MDKDLHKNLRIEINKNGKDKFHNSDRHNYAKENLMLTRSIVAFSLSITCGMIFNIIQGNIRLINVQVDRQIIPTL